MQDAEWLTDREQQAWRAYLSMERAISRRLAQQLQRELGLSWADYEVLVRLHEAPGHSLRAVELAAATQWEKSRLAHQLGRMADRGLVVRNSCGNTRHAHVTLSAEGAAVIEAAAPAHVSHVRKAFIDVLSPEQLEALHDIATTVLGHLGPVVPACPGEEAVS